MEEALRHMESLGELFNKNDEWFTSNYNSDCWYIKNLGVNLIGNALTPKTYYSLKSQSINIHKKKEALESLTISCNLQVAKHIKKFISRTGANLLDISFKKYSADKYRKRFTLRIEQVNKNLNELTTLFADLGFNHFMTEINRVNSCLKCYVSKEINPIFSVGFEYGLGNLEKIMLYFGFWPKEILPEWSQDDQYHKNDTEMLKYILDFLSIEPNLKKIITELQGCFLERYTYMDFLGIDFMLDGEMNYKLYFRVKDNLEIKSLYNCLCKYNISVNERNLTVISNYMKQRKTLMDVLALCFNEKRLLGIQLYYKEIRGV